MSPDSLLAPADLPKDYGRFDLPIAIGVLLVASKQIQHPERLAKCVFIGELPLSGSLKPVYGAMAIALSLARRPDKAKSILVLPYDNDIEAGAVPGVRVQLVASMNP